MHDFFIDAFFSSAGVWQKVQPHMALHCWEELWQLCYTWDKTLHLFLPGSSGHSTVQVRLKCKHAFIPNTNYVFCRNFCENTCHLLPSLQSYMEWRFTHLWIKICGYCVSPLFILCVFLCRIPILHVALISNRQFLLKCLYILCGMKLEKILRLLLKT